MLNKIPKPLINMEVVTNEDYIQKFLVVRTKVVIKYIIILMKVSDYYTCESHAQRHVATTVSPYIWVNCYSWALITLKISEKVTMCL